MKYRKITILYDNGIDVRNAMKNINATARKAGIDRGWLSKILHDKVVASENAYLKIKKAISFIS